MVQEGRGGGEEWGKRCNKRHFMYVSFAMEQNFLLIAEMHNKILHPKCPQRVNFMVQRRCMNQNIFFALAHYGASYFLWSSFILLGLIVFHDC